MSDEKIDEATLAKLAKIDTEIGQQITMIDSALRDLDRAQKEVKDCQRSAVRSAWNLGKLLQERKDAGQHGDWTPYLKNLSQRTGKSERTLRDYMLIAKHIGSAANLEPSIRQTLEAVQQKDIWAKATEEREKQRKAREQAQQPERQKEQVEALARSNREALGQHKQIVPQPRKELAPEDLRDYAEHEVEMFPEEDNNLPETVPECHALIRELRQKIRDLAGATAQVAAEKNEMMQERDR